MTMRSAIRLSAAVAAVGITAVGCLNSGWAYGVDPTPAPKPTPKATSTSAPLPTPAPTPAPISTVKPAPKPAPTSQIPRNPVRTTAKVVYLTFDDGPDPRFTPQVLALLKRYDAKATFFVIGASAKKHPRVVQQVRRQGHALANHTYSHPWLNRLSSAAIADQLRRTDAVIGRTTCMRPPGGFVTRTVIATARAEGKQVVMWNADPKDWTRPGTAAIASRVMTATRHRSIVLLHDGGGQRAQSVAALSQILANLSAQGYRFESLPACRVPAPKPVVKPAPKPVVKPAPKPVFKPAPATPAAAE